jgi:hypothetical protein
MREKRTQLGALGFALALGAGWLGCAADAVPEKAPERTAATSQSLTIPSAVQCSGPTTTVYAYPHSTSSYPGYLTRYTDRFPVPCGSGAGYVTTCGSAVNQYEDAVWSQVYRSNGYEYKVNYCWSTPNGPQCGVFLGVGINSDIANPPYSMSPPAADTNGPPTTPDWDAEYTLASENQAYPVSARFPPVTCAEVRAVDTGEVLDFFAVIDLHDPYNPPW